MENFEQNQTMGTPSDNQTPKKKTGLEIVAAVVILALLILGGFYLWGSKLTKQEMMEGNENQQQKTMTVETVSDDDSLNTIENEASATQIDSTGDFDYTLDQ